MKGKKLLAIGAALALVITGCAGANSLIRRNPHKAYSGAPVHTSYKLDGTITGGSSGYDTASTITQDGVGWKVYGNTTINPWRIGGKSLGGVDRKIYSTTAFTENTNRIDITFGAVSGVTVNSLKVGVYSTAAAAEDGTGSANRVASFTPVFSANNTVTINKADDTSWANCYFNITMNITVSVNSNKYVEFKSALFTFDNGGGSEESSSSQAPSNPSASSSADSSSSSLPPVTYTLTYNPVSNSGTGTGTITDESSPYVSGTQVTVKDSTGFTAPTGMVFSHWYTTPTGSDGTRYDPGDNFNISTNTTLYAQWIDDPSITYTTAYSTGFESSEGFENSTTYNTTKDNQGPVGKQWKFYYGTASTGTPITGSQSLQMRWYGSASSNYPYAQTKFASREVRRISFKYKTQNQNVDFKTQYNTDGGDSWTDIETIDTPNGNAATYKKVFETAIPVFYFRVVVCLGTAPASGKNYEFRIDDVLFETDATVATINGDSNVSVGIQWSPESITENVSGDPVTGVTYSFATSGGAVISSSNTSTGAFTCSAAGTVTVSAIKSGFFIYDKAVTVDPISAYIDPEEDEVSGFTGQNETISFDYGNLNNSLSVVSNNTSVVTISSLSTDDVSGTVQFNYVGAGSTIVSFKDGEMELASVSVSVTLSTVTITGLAASKEVYIGKTINLGSSITVTATGSCHDNVTWKSEDEAIASVTSEGVVTGVAEGTVDISVTPNDYAAGKEVCTVTVSPMPVSRMAVVKSISVGDTVYLISSGVSMQYNGPSSSYSNAYGVGEEYTDAPDRNGLALEVEEGTADDSFAFKIKSGVYADDYLGWASGSNNLNATDDEITANSSWYVSFDENGNSTITNAAEAGRNIWWNVKNPRFASYSGDKADGEDYKYVQLCKLVTPDYYSDNSTSVSALYADETELGVVENVSLRFGLEISQADWDAIDDEWGITDYGVMMFRTTEEQLGNCLTVKEYYDASQPLAVVRQKVSVDTPYEDPYLDGDTYRFLAQINITRTTSYNLVYVAAPFVVAGGQYYFLTQVHASVNSLAHDYRTNGGSSLSDAALEYLETTHS